MPKEMGRASLRNSFIELALKTSNTTLLLNGASAVALLAFIGQVWPEDNTGLAVDGLLHLLFLLILGTTIALSTLFFASLMAFHNYCKDGKEPFQRVKWIKIVDSYFLAAPFVCSLTFVYCFGYFTAYMIDGFLATN